MKVMLMFTSKFHSIKHLEKGHDTRIPNSKRCVLFILDNLCSVYKVCITDALQLKWVIF